MSDRPEVSTADGADAAAADAPGDGPSHDAPATVPGEEPVTVEEVEAGAADAHASATPGGGEWTPDQIDALVAERDEFLEAYQRTAADFDNFRKQSQRRATDEVARVQGGFVERLLPVLDAIEAARAAGSGDVEAVAGALFGFLEKEGLERLDPDGAPFDPNEAEAVMHEPGDGQPTVVEVLRTGYRWQGRVIRPAMVKVAG